MLPLAVRLARESVPPVAVASPPARVSETPVAASTRSAPDCPMLAEVAVTLATSVPPEAMARLRPEMVKLSSPASSAEWVRV